MNGLFFPDRWTYRLTVPCRAVGLPTHELARPPAHSLIRYQRLEERASEPVSERERERERERTKAFEDGAAAAEETQGGKNGSQYLKKPIKTQCHDPLVLFSVTSVLCRIFYDLVDCSPDRFPLVFSVIES